MRRAIKRFIRAGIAWTVSIAARSAAGRYILDQLLSSTTNRAMQVRHRGGELTFVVPNSLNHFRIETFSTKEPETLEWIDGIPADSVVWDIGANIGLYTCYAAKFRRCRVYAFEPSVFNLELLARNIFLNDLTDQATIIPLPLSDALAVNTLNMSCTDWGGALSSFGQTYGHDGRTLSKVFGFRTMGISMTDAVTLLRIPPPDYVKMDVDGIEHLILKGGAAILREVKGVLIEINEEFAQQLQDSTRYLSAAGLVLKEKRHADMSESSLFRNTYNQIWQRPDAAGLT